MNKLYEVRMSSLILLVSIASTVANSQTAFLAQSIQAANQSKSTSIHLSIAQGSYVVGQKPIAVLTISNLSSEPLWLAGFYWQYRVHVTSTNGTEPEKTELHRHMLGDFRRGDGPQLSSGPVAGRDLAPGSAYSETYDLSAYYDLDKAADYSVYLELYDPAGPQDGSARWLRTNAVKFEIKQPGN